MGQSIAESNAAQMARQCGRTVLWAGQETYNWGLAEWAACAHFARSLGIDSICGKVADGTIRWYNGLAGLAAIRDTVHGEGAGFIPFAYCYGPKFGLEQVRGECVMLAELLHVSPIAQADMEAEWDNQTEAAQLFASLMRPVQGLLSITTWADPVEQSWEGVAHELAPCANQWVPQEYDNWLAAQEGQYDKGVFTCLAPGVDLRPEFGADNALAIVEAALRDGHQTVYLWEYGSAQGNESLVRQVVAAMEHIAAPPAIAATPAPAQGPQTPSGGAYRVQPGDTLSSIAFAHHISVDALLAANPFIVRADLLQQGWVLAIP